MPALPPPITSRTNARVKALRASLSGEARRSGDLLGLEGERLVKEATLAGLSLDTLYLREGSEAMLERRGWPEQVRTAQWAVLSRDVFDSAVSTASPQGIAATWVICDLPETRPQHSALILEDLQDPGNLGTLIRSAAAFGMGSIFVTPNTANQWNPKVVRSAAGAIFRQQITRSSMEDIVQQLRSEGVRIFAAVSGFASGPDAGTPVMAAPHGVLRGRINNYEAESPRYHGLEDAQEREATNGYAASLSYDTDFVDPCAIMIGNEGAGLSREACALADEQVLIPGVMESLNAAVAGSILMYEMMRQRPLRAWAQRQGIRA